MLEVGLGESKDSFVEFAQEDNCAGSNKDVDLAYNLGGDEGDVIFMPILGEEAIEVDHLLVEPCVVRTLENNLSLKNVEKPLTMGDLPFCAGCYSQRDHYGILDADADQVGRQALNHELIDGMLQGAEVDENLHVTCNILCDCSDYLLNNSLLDYPSNSDSAVTNIGLECQIQFMEKEGGDDKSALQYTAQSLTVGTSDNAALPLDSINFHERHETLHGTFGWDATVGEHKRLKNHMLFDQQSKTVLDNVSNLMDRGLLSNENDDNMILTSDNIYGFLVDVSHSRALHSKVGALMDEHSTEGCQAAMINLNLENCKDSGETNNAVMTTKRLRKPTRRYIEETSEIKKKCSYERFKTPLVSFKNNYHHERTECQHHCRSAMQLLHEDCPDKVHSLRDHQTKHVKQLVSDNKRRILPSDSPKITFCPTLHDSEQQGERQDENCTAIMRQRKHHRQWTLSEVVKLVDGVSQYGVGRWTEIKRLLFSATAYRTAVDLKDKWRNLLRASVILSRNRNLVDPQKKQASSPIPESIMWRVRELSIIHPYPRDRKLRIKTAPTTPVTFSGTSNASIINLRSRIRPNRSFA